MVDRFRRRELIDLDAVQSYDDLLVLGQRDLGAQRFILPMDHVLGPQEEFGPWPFVRRIRYLSPDYRIPTSRSQGKAW